MMHREVGETGEDIGFETLMRRRDGALRDVEVRRTGFMRGRRKLWLCLCHDITERKDNERALRASEAQQRSVLSALSEAVLVFDPEGRVVSMNRAAEAEAQRAAISPSVTRRRNGSPSAKMAARFGTPNCR